MQTESLERTLRDALRETLDRELGPDPAWTGSPAARRVAALERRRRWPLRELAVAAVLSAAGGVALLSGAANLPLAYSNGWVAFAVSQEESAADADADLWFTALGEEPRRVVGSDTDSVDQVCPAFAPDGRSIAYGSIEVIRSAAPAWAYRNSALVVADVADDGGIAERLTIDVGDGLPPACAVWSPAGDLLAFGVPSTLSGDPIRSGEGKAVWIVRPANGDITVIPDLLVTDLEWSPDGSVLAVAGWAQPSSDGLRNPQVHLYELSAGTLRTLGETFGAASLTWSPDGGRIAYAGRELPHSPVVYDNGGPLRIIDVLRVIDVRTGQQEVLTDPYSAIHGLGPVWSPDGKAIAYQRSADVGVGGGAEGHEVVLVTVDGRSENPGPASEVVMPNEVTTADGSIVQLWPWRVTWSPDGSYLMYVAWTHEQTVVVAVPTDADAPAVILADVDGIDAYDLAGNAARVQIQVWQRLPAGPAR